MNLISGFSSLFEFDAPKRLSSRCSSTRDGGSCVSSSSWRIPGRAWKCLRISRSLSKRYLGALFIIALPKFELLLSVRDNRVRLAGRCSVRGSPDIFVKLLRENVGANLPFDALADFETRSHTSKVLLNWNWVTRNAERISEVKQTWGWTIASARLQASVTGLFRPRSENICKRALQYSTL